ncbi:MAG TPA: tryptophan synthase subunit alpha [bacterium]|nr:tryptophan synthase subunit alpha [bacterium]
MPSSASSAARGTTAASQAGISRVHQAFADLKRRHRKALIIYVMAGDPNPAFTARLVPRLAEAGANLVELGYPFSDPVADGPVIQAAGQRALRQFAGLDDFFALIRQIRARCGLPLLAMTYYNLIFRYGEAAYVRNGLAAGLDGTIIPDLPLVEAATWHAQCLSQGMAPVFLEAPNTPDEDAQRIARTPQGFIYLVSLKGVTGSDRGLGENLAQRVQRLRAWTDTPLVVGFGISTPEQARQMGALCDGVVVGSGVVSRLAQAKSPDAAEGAVLDYVRALRAGLDG